MTDYSKATNFAAKDSLASGNPLKVVKGTEIDDEFEAIETAIGTKANLASPTFTGVPKAPTAATGTNTTQLATTAFVQAQVDADVAAIDLTNSIGADEIVDNSVGADELNVSSDGTAGQFLISDGDGSFSWTAIAVLSPAASNPTTRDDGTSLAEGDQYYNTTDDELRTWDGSAWATVVQTFDAANGATGTTSTPPVGSLVSGTLFLEQSVYYLTSGYGDTITFSPTTAFIRYYYNFQQSSINGMSSQIDNSTAVDITSGTWRYLGSSLYQRVS